MAKSDSGWISAGGLAAFAGGVLVAAIASRVLPPLVAQAMARAGGRDPFQALADDHRHILALLTEMEQTRPNATLRRAQLLLRLKRRLAAHAMAEEDVVYPLLHQSEREDTRRLYSEHADMKMHLFALERMAKDDPDWLGRVTELKMLIAEHVHQEEAVDFPRLRDTLGRHATARLSGTVQREKALLL